MSKKVVLLILDGWGLGDGSKSDAITHAKTPFVDSLYEKYPHSTVLTFGENVGLPDGQMGNSEVGHLNIGAGRIVYQDLAKINKEVREKKFFSNPVLLAAFEDAKKNNRNVHFMGLLSDGGVHSHEQHLWALCEMVEKNNLPNVFIHAFTDGRDTDPKSGISFLKKLQQKIENTNIKIASIIGRYYAMDRDKRWERIQLAYNLLVKGEGKRTTDYLQSVEESYSENITDEFIKPLICTDKSGNPIAIIKENDVVICFNFRTDRCREITQVLTQQDFPKFGMKKLFLNYITMTNYDDDFKNVKIVYDKDHLHQTLGEVLANAGKKQIRMAETEKYPHVTFFFSGGRETIFESEKRILIPSLKVATYDLQPEMSAIELKNELLKELQKNEADFICLNFANADMVGHTGVYSAIVKAVETVDKCVQEIVETGIKNNYSFIIIADHGNADYAVNTDGSPNTAHSKNLVPCILIDNQYKKINKGKLADIAPTILKLMDVEIPVEMTGNALI
ncbi:MAG: 2,3-bisphosphoglycerate-independent phosphoglycerate mutase [Bacteroidia bacterium]